MATARHQILARGTGGLSAALQAVENGGGIGEDLAQRPRQRLAAPAAEAFQGGAVLRLHLARRIGGETWRRVMFDEPRNMALDATLLDLRAGAERPGDKRHCRETGPGREKRHHRQSRLEPERRCAADRCGKDEKQRLRCGGERGSGDGIGIKRRMRHRRTSFEFGSFAFARENLKCGLTALVSQSKIVQILSHTRDRCAV